MPRHVENAASWNVRIGPYGAMQWNEGVFNETIALELRATRGHGARKFSGRQPDVCTDTLYVRSPCIRTLYRGWVAVSMLLRHNAAGPTDA